MRPISTTPLDRANTQRDDQPHGQILATVSVTLHALEADAVDHIAEINSFICGIADLTELS